MVFRMACADKRRLEHYDTPQAEDTMNDTELKSWIQGRDAKIAIEVVCRVNFQNRHLEKLGDGLPRLRNQCCVNIRKVSVEFLVGDVSAGEQHPLHSAMHFCITSVIPPAKDESRRKRRCGNRHGDHESLTEIGACHEERADQSDDKEGGCDASSKRDHSHNILNRPDHFSRPHAQHRPRHSVEIKLYHQSPACNSGHMHSDTQLVSISVSLVFRFFFCKSLEWGKQFRLSKGTKEGNTN